MSFRAITSKLINYLFREPYLLVLISFGVENTADFLSIKKSNRTFDKSTSFVSPLC